MRSALGWSPLLGGDAVFLFGLQRALAAETCDEPEPDLHISGMVIEVRFEALLPLFRRLMRAVIATR